MEMEEGTHSIGSQMDTRGCLGRPCKKERRGEGGLAYHPHGMLSQARPPCRRSSPPLFCVLEEWSRGLAEERERGIRTGTGSARVLESLKLLYTACRTLPGPFLGRGGYRLFLFLFLFLSFFLFTLLFLGRKNGVDFGHESVTCDETVTSWPHCITASSRSSMASPV